MDWKKIGSSAMSNNVVVIALIVAGLIAYAKYAPDSMKTWTNAPQPASQPKDPAANVERVEVPGPVKVTVIPKKKYTEKLPDVLTPATVQDNSAQVIASATIPPSPAGGPPAGPPPPPPGGRYRVRHPPYRGRGRRGIDRVPGGNAEVLRGAKGVRCQ